MKWDESVDLVIIGSGGGGFAAAIAAADAGLKPLIVEKQSVLGGSTAMSGGVVWLPNNPLMRADHVDDSTEAGLAYFEDVVGNAGPGSTIERRRTYIATGSVMVSLLQRKGVRFERAEGYSDYYSDAAGGSERGRSIEPLPFDAKRLGKWRDNLAAGMAKHIGFVVKTNELRSVQYFNRSPRAFMTASRVFARTWGSRLLGKDLLTNGASLIGQMLNVVLKDGTPIWLDTSLLELIVEGDKVVGVRVDKDGETVTVEARRGVVLAAGGFAHNARMRREFSGDQPNDGRWSMANPGDTGEVLEMAMGLGAKTDLMDEAWWLPSTIPQLGGSTLSQARQRPGAILVDQEGRRFSNEANSMLEVSKAMYARGAVPCWAIMDEGYRRRYTNGLTLPGRMPEKWFDNGWVHKADTVEGLAVKIGLDPLALSSTVATFNASAKYGLDPEFGRGVSAYNRAMGDPGYRGNAAIGPLTKAPFYAAEIFPADVGTCGGLVTDEHARVLDQADNPIAGLYATGNITATVMGRTYLGAGGSIAYTMIFGTVAALDAASVSLA